VIGIITPPGVRVARWAVTGVFAVNGLLVATYLVRIPSLKSTATGRDPDLLGRRRPADHATGWRHGRALRQCPRDPPDPLLRAAPGRRRPGTRRPPRASRDRRTGWTGPVRVLGTLGVALMLCEATVVSWSGVFLHDNRGATLAQAALGYGAFTLFQTVGRLAGDPFTQRLGRTRVFRVYAAIAVVGFVVVLTG
jgi:hypothetical protein